MIKVAMVTFNVSLFCSFVSW